MSNVTDLVKHTLVSLDDVNVSGPALGDIIAWNGTSWDSTPSFSYTLPVASDTVLGGVRVGAGLTMTGDILSNDSYIVPYTAGAANQLTPTNYFSGQTNTTNQIKIAYYVPIGGVIRARIELGAEGPALGLAYCQVYVNGLARGPVHSINAWTYQMWDDDITVNAGDLVAGYFYMNQMSSYSGALRLHTGVTSGFLIPSNNLIV